MSEWLRSRSRKPVGPLGSRGFESHPLRFSLPTDRSWPRQITAPRSVPGHSEGQQEQRSPPGIGIVYPLIYEVNRGDERRSRENAMSTPKPSVVPTLLSTRLSAPRLNLIRRPEWSHRPPLPSQKSGAVGLAGRTHSRSSYLRPRRLDSPLLPTHPGHRRAARDHSPCLPCTPSSFPRRSAASL